MAAALSVFHRICSIPQIDGETMNVVALDGLPLTYHDPRRHPEVLKHLLIVQGPEKALRSLCVSTPARTETKPEHAHYNGETAIDHSDSSVSYVSPSRHLSSVRANDI
jgi:hypothetical protein